MPTRVLVAEDDDRSRELMAEVLADAGYDVTRAANGSQALKELRSGKEFAVAVLDIQMPEVDGISVAREVRRDPQLARLRLLAVTALAQPADVLRILEAGCDAYLAKPISVADVRLLVADLIRDRAANEVNAVETALAGPPASSEPSRSLPEGFIPMMSHAVRTPLTAILGYAEMLDSDERGYPDEDRRYIREIRRAGEYLLMLVNDIRDYSRLGEGRHTFQSEDVRVDELIGEITQEFAGVATQAGLELRSLVQESSLAIRCDRQALRRIIANLIAYGIRSTDTGSVEISARSADQSTVIEVKSGGPGLSAEERTRIFEPFGGGTAPIGRGGTGLELALAKHLAEYQGGALRVYSALGRGATFIVQFPASASDSGL